MRIIVTAGPTREHIDAVRFITNASSGKMGLALACAAAEAGHDVTLICGPVGEGLPEAARRPKCDIVRFVTAADLQQELEGRFDSCDALVMAAAVGDFRPGKILAGKTHRANGPMDIRLLPTSDIVAALGARKRAEQKVVVFSVEEGADAQLEAVALRKLAAKNADFVVVNCPAAMTAEASRACILSAGGVALPWAIRSKTELSVEIIKLIG